MNEIKDTELQEINEILYKLLWCQLSSLGLFREKYPELANVREQAGILAGYHRWLQASIAHLESKQYVYCHSTAVEDGCYACSIAEVATPEKSANVWQLWEQHKVRWMQNNDIKAYVLLVETMLRALPDILTGKRHAAEVMFPNGSMALVEGIYQGNRVSDYFNEVLATLVVAYVRGLLAQKENVHIRLLEIGAGLGGTTSWVLRSMQPYHAFIEEYCYSDISQAFLDYGQQAYGANNPFLTYRLLNVEQSMGEQGIELGRYDIVIATNVLHATRNIRHTVRHAKEALSKHGLLLLNEITNTSLFAHLTFGLLDGWWAYEDPELRIAGSPILSVESWQAVLSSEGFGEIYLPTWGQLPTEAWYPYSQQVIVAESDGIVQGTKASVKKGEQQSVELGASPASINRTDQKVKEYVESIILESMAEVLRIDEKTIEEERSFSEYGVDSIIAIKLINTINEKSHLALRTTALFDNNNIGQLTQYILRENQASLKFSAPSAHQAPGMVTSITDQHIRERSDGIGELERYEPIAIIGMSGRFAQSENVNELWEHLAKGTDLVEEVSRWELGELDPVSAETKEPYCKYGSFLTGIDLFDPHFFAISKMEAIAMDPQQRLVLQEAWKALEDAGYMGSSIEGQRCGVYMGCTPGDYQQLFDEIPPAQAFWGNAASVIPARIAYYLDLTGPAMAIDTACSSSLVAIHLACQGLWSGETDMALAGGVFLLCTPRFYQAGNRAGMLSATGRCAPFDNRADGFVPGEGVGIVVLKRLKDALACGDHIYGVIRGSGINQDGATRGITVPSARSQERLLRSVYETFQIDPEQIQMMEAHGTGTKLGDPIEYEALTRAFRHYTPRKEYCALGSIKSNLGHTATTAGVAGVIKILQSLQHRQIPPSLHFTLENEHIKLQESPFYVNTQLQEWLRPISGTSRRAAVSSFGFSGTNAHLVIEEAPDCVCQHSEKPGYLIVLSARTEDQLRQQAEQLAAFCECRVALDCGNMSYTLLLGRKHLKYRLACVISSHQELGMLLRKWLTKGKAAPQIAVSNLESREQRETPSLKRYGNQCLEACQSTNEPGTYLEHLATVAELYLQGYALAFERLFVGQGYERISLPTYPFARERCWIEKPLKEAVWEPSAETRGMRMEASPVATTLMRKEEVEERKPPEVRIFLAELYQAQISERQEMLEKYLQDVLASMLAFQSPNVPELHKGFFDLGMDSVMAEQLRASLEATLCIDIAETAIFNYPNISALAEYIIKRIPFAELEQHDLIYTGKQEKRRRRETEQLKKEKELIAVIGMGCRFPGGCATPEAFWQFLTEGRDGVIEVPRERFRIEDFYDPDPNATGKIYLKEAGFLQENIGDFDARFFGLSPREVVEMDPQQRLLLEVSWEALERAGIAADRLKGTQTGIFIGIIGSEYSLLSRENIDGNPYRLTGSMSNIASGRISYILGVHGPAISLDTACSSSLVALHLACESLQRGESSLALAGGVNLLLAPQIFLSLCGLRALAADGRCKTFDAAGDGYGRGEGCGVVVLKRLSDALRENDPILAVIKGTGVNQDGSGSGLTVPNGIAQKALILKTQETANVSPDDISYVELHGTGTALGDPIEFQALMEVFGTGDKRERPLMLGAVKSNIGHLEAAAGIASFIKAVLCLQHKQIPPSLHLKQINPKVHLESIPATVPQQLVSWESNGTPRTLGMSSFGFSGTNAHVIVSEWENTELLSEQITWVRPWHILALSAKDEDALYQLVARYEKHLEQKREDQIEDICFTASTGRAQFARRVAFLAKDREQMKTVVADYVRGNKSEHIVEEKGRDHTRPKIAFLIQGTIHQGVAQSLFETQSIFQQTMRSCNERLEQLAQISLLEKHFSGESIPDVKTAGWLDDTLAFALHLSLVRVWEAWGVRPDAVMGGSRSGELVAACAAGVMDVEAAYCLLLEHWGVSIKGNDERTLNEPQLRIISGYTGRTVERQEARSWRYWQQVLHEEPNKQKGLESLCQLGDTHLLQTGPREDVQDCEECLHGTDIQYLTSVTEGDPWGTLTHTLAHLYCLGIHIDWSGFERGYSRRKVLVPTYPFQREHFWCENTMAQPASKEKAAREKDMASRGKSCCNENLLDGRVIDCAPKTKQIEYNLRIEAVPDVKDTHSVLHVGYYLEMLCRAVKQSYDTTAFRVQTIHFLTPVIMPESEAVTLLLTLNETESTELKFSFCSRLREENWKKHTEGTIRLRETEVNLKVDTGLQAEMISRSENQYAKSEFYQHLQERGIILGERVQWLKQIWASSGEALALLSIPQSLQTSHTYEIGVHPGVFDACAQLFHAALPTDTHKDMRYMVTQWEDFACKNQPVDAVLWCHVMLQEGPQTNGQLRGKFRLFDQKGTVVAQIESGVMKGLNREREDLLRSYLEQSQTVKERKDTSEIMHTLRALHHDQWRDRLNEYLQQMMAQILRMEVGKLSRDESLMNLGIDSLVGMEAKIKLEEELGISLPIEQFIIGPSIRELTEVIIEHLVVEPTEAESVARESNPSVYNMDIGTWIVHRKSNAKARVKLFCFPYGISGGAAVYRSWQAMLPEYIEVCPVQLPGKENRVKETAFTDIERATDVLKQVLEGELDRPYAFYGHSVGAFLAYRLAYKLWSELDCKPGHLFVGAYSSPTIQPNPVVTLIRGKLKQIGYEEIPDAESLSSITQEKIEEIITAMVTTTSASVELLRLFLATTLGELQMVRNCDNRDKIRFDIPIVAFHGRKDDRVSESEIAAWREVTRGAFKLYTLPGDHLFLHENQDQKQLLELIARDLETYRRQE